MIFKPKYMIKVVALIGFCFCSCTERTLEPRPEVEPVPIRLYTGIRTRALVSTFGETSVGIAYGSRTGEYDGAWDGVATDNEIRLTPERYYPADGSALFLRGYYPPAPLEADGSLTYRLTGEEDLMLTGEQSGSLSSPFGPAEEQSLMYCHLLTRLSFALTIEAENTEGFRIRELHLNGLAGEVSLSLATELLTAADETVSVPIYTVEEGGDGLGFTDGKLSLPGYVLVQPSATFTLDLTLAVDDDRTHDRVYRELPIRFEGGGGRRGRHLVYGEGGVTLTFSTRSCRDKRRGHSRRVAGGETGKRRTGWRQGKR